MNGDGSADIAYMTGRFKTMVAVSLTGLLTQVLHLAQVLHHVLQPNQLASVNIQVSED